MSGPSLAPRSPCPRCIWLLRENGNGNSGVESCYYVGPLIGIQARKGLARQYFLESRQDGRPSVENVVEGSRIAKFWPVDGYMSIFHG